LLGKGLSSNVFKGRLYVTPTFIIDVAVKVQDFEITQEAEVLAFACRLGGLLPLLARSPTLRTTFRVELQPMQDGGFRLLQVKVLCPEMLESLLQKGSTVPGSRRMLLQLPDLERKMPEGARDVKGTRAGCLLRPLSAGIPWSDQWCVLVSVLEGLPDLHSAGLVKGDLKLDNIGLQYHGVSPGGRAQGPAQPALALWNTHLGVSGCSGFTWWGTDCSKPRT
jgi:hypothetical protein